MFKIKMILFIFMLPILSQAQLIEKQYTLEVDASSAPQAQNLLQEKAIETATLELMRSYIGEERLSKNKSALQKILPSSSEYIPYSKRGAIKKIGDKKYQMTVTLRVSRDSLKEILLKTGLLYDNQENPIVLSLVTFNLTGSEDHVYRWWNTQSEKSEMNTKLYGFFEKHLTNSLWANQFYLLPSQKKHLGEWFSEDLKVNTFNKSHFEKLDKQFKTQILITGSIEIEQESDFINEIRTHIQAIHSGNFRVIGSINRKMKMGKKDLPETVFKNIAEDMASQIADVWKKGSLGSQSMLVSFNGKYDLKGMEKFKGELKNASFVKGIRERYVSSNGFSFEIDTHLDFEQFKKQLSEQNFKSAKLQKNPGSAGENKLFFNFNIL